MKIALISDVHLEYSNGYKDFALPKADVLVCAGDIGSPFTISYKRFLRDSCKKYKNVIVISGNHEYYNQSPCISVLNPRVIKDIEAKIQKVCDDVGAIYLQKKYVDIGYVRFYGCTLWADPTKSNGEKHWESRHDTKHIPDFKCVDDYINLHKDHKEWLEKELDKKFTTKRVVITHHLPSYKLIDPKFARSEKNGYYASECDKLIDKTDVWLAGHTHRYIETEICDGTRLYCNPVGYPWEHICYNKSLLIKI